MITLMGIVVVILGVFFLGWAILSLFMSGSGGSSTAEEAMKHVYFCAPIGVILVFVGVWMI